MLFHGHKDELSGYSIRGGHSAFMEPLQIFEYLNTSLKLIQKAPADFSIRQVQR
jgi:hypothetical protein